jgi:hypothetical protein
MGQPREAVLGLPGLVSFWDFQQPAGQQRLAHGPGAYALREAGGVVERIDGGVFGAHAARFAAGRWLECPREACPLLDIHGPDAELSVLAWLKREPKQPAQCEAVAGLWHESGGRRQYALFLDLHLHDSRDQVGGHVSADGGPTPGHPYCLEAAIGASAVAPGAWRFAAFTYGREPDGAQRARVYLDGELDRRAGLNPYDCPGGIFNGGSNGSDFTVAAVHRQGEMGNWFVGALGGLAVCNRALDGEAIAALHRHVPLPH